MHDASELDLIFFEKEPCPLLSGNDWHTILLHRISDKLNRGEGRQRPSYTDPSSKSGGSFPPDNNVAWWIPIKFQNKLMTGEGDRGRTARCLFSSGWRCYILCGLPITAIKRICQQFIATEKIETPFVAIMMNP